MKKQLFLLAAILAMASSTPAWAYDFSAVAPSGQTLYYNIESGSAHVTYQNSSIPSYSNLTGALTIPSSVTYNGTTYTVTTIGSYAFRNCSGLTSVTIPNSVTSIGNHAFSVCSGLTSVTIGSGVTSIGEHAFYNCTGCTSLTSTIYTGTIAQWCGISFGSYSANPLCYSHSLTIGGTEITNLVIHGVTEIRQYAFYGCSGLTSVTIGNSVTSIGKYAFFGCSGLTSVTIPNSVTSIGNIAFYGCSGLTSVTIPSSVTSIGYDAFYGCSGLTSVTIPNRVTSLGVDAFSGCTGLTSVTLGNNNLSVFSNDTTKGEARIELPTGYTSNLWNKTVRAIATAKTVNQFVAWSDGNTDNPRTVTVIGNADTAYFESTTQGITDIDAADITIYVSDGRIVARGAEGMEMRLFDIMGREVMHPTHNGETPVMPAGVYLIKVGAYPARKVVVIR